MDIEKHLALIQSNFPHITIAKVKPVTMGWDSFVLQINDSLIFRFPMRDDVVSYLQKEKQLLPLLASHLSTPIPRFTFFGQGNAEYPYEFVGYNKLQGVTLEPDQITNEHLQIATCNLGTFLSELHSFPTEQATLAGIPVHTPELWHAMYRERYIDLQNRVFPILDSKSRTKSTQVWSTFLDDTHIFTFTPKLIHSDLNCEHILYNPTQGKLSGIIDWGDASIGDPALDFVGVYRTHGKKYVEQMLAHYTLPIDSSFWTRMTFYQRYEPFSKLLYGSYGHQDIFAQGLEELHTLSLD